MRYNLGPEAAELIRLRREKKITHHEYNRCILVLLERWCAENYNIDEHAKHLGIGAQ